MGEPGPAPHLHREAYLHVLQQSGLGRHHAEALYARVIDADCWTPYPDAGAVLDGLGRRGIKTAVVSNIAFDVRPASRSLGVADAVDEFVVGCRFTLVDPLPTTERPDGLRAAVTAQGIELPA